MSPQLPPPPQPEADPSSPALARSRPPLRQVVLVGLMGAGKTAVGKRLALALGTPFVDADEEIVAAAGMSIADIFETYGESQFRDLERRVVARLLHGPIGVLALGGGAFIDPETRARVKADGRSVWLKADLDTLAVRTSRKRAQRPLLAQGDLRQVLAELMDRRYPIYAEADLVVETGEQTADAVVARLLDLLVADGTCPQA